MLRLPRVEIPRRRNRALHETLGDLADARPGLSHRFIGSRWGGIFGNRWVVFVARFDFEPAPEPEPFEIIPYQGRVTPVVPYGSPREDN